MDRLISKMLHNELLMQKLIFYVSLTVIVSEHKLRFPITLVDKNCSEEVFF